MSSSLIYNWIADHNTLEKEAIVFNWGIFEKNEISALYLDNFGDSLQENLIYFGIFLVTVFITKFTTRSYGRKAYLVTFSFLVASILGMVQSHVLFSTLQIFKSSLPDDKYSYLSLVSAIIATLILIGLLAYCFSKLLKIYKYQKRMRKDGVELSSTKAKPSSRDRQFRELMEKYEFLFGEFKTSNKNQFFFVYWLTGFSMIYILLIFSLQDTPKLQCFSIVGLVLAFIVFSALIKPFKEKIPAFLHFFNFACILIAAICNLALAFTSDENSSSFSETQGRLIFAIIVINTATNMLFAFGGMVIEIVSRIRSLFNKRKKVVPVVEVSDLRIQPKIKDTNKFPIQEKLTIIQLDSPTLQSNERNIHLTNTNLAGNETPQVRLDASRIFTRTFEQGGNDIIINRLDE